MLHTCAKISQKLILRSHHDHWAKLFESFSYTSVSKRGSSLNSHIFYSEWLACRKNADPTSQLSLKSRTFISLHPKISKKSWVAERHTWKSPRTLIRKLVTVALLVPTPTATLTPTLIPALAPTVAPALATTVAPVLILTVNPLPHPTVFDHVCAFVTFSRSKQRGSSVLPRSAGPSAMSSPNASLVVVSKSRSAVVGSGLN